MAHISKTSILAAALFSIAMLLFAACQPPFPTPTTGTLPSSVDNPTPTPGPAPDIAHASTHEIVSGREPDASVKGTITYRENLQLTSGAVLEVELRDVSLQDVASILIARQTISSPGQVPISYDVKYSIDDINPGNTYGVTARIIESDGRLAFTNDTAHDVITQGNPHRVNMVLVLVEPPPDLIDESNPDWRNWIELPASVISANLVPDETDNYLKVNYYQSSVEDCVRPGGQSFEMDGYDIFISVTLMEPPRSTWAVPCPEQIVEVDTFLDLGDVVEPGKAYRVIANGRVITTFSLPPPDFDYTLFVESPIESWQVEILDTNPAQHRLRVVSGLSAGSGCSWFNGYELRRNEKGDFHVIITHHEISDPSIACTTDYPTVETLVPLGPDLVAGRVYSISVNSETARTFEAR